MPVVVSKIMIMIFYSQHCLRSCYLEQEIIFLCNPYHESTRANQVSCARITKQERQPTVARLGYKDTRKKIYVGPRLQV